MSKSRKGLQASLHTLIGELNSSPDPMEDVTPNDQVTMLPLTTSIFKPKRKLLALSDEILELIVQQVDRHDDLPNLRLACKKLLRLSERHMYRNFVVTLPEEVDIDKWRSKLETMPDSIKLIKYLTLTNQNITDDGYFYRHVVPCAGSYRIQRWSFLEDKASRSKAEFEKAAFFFGSKFRWDVRLETDQLISFRWRHATTLSYELLCKIMTSQAGSLQELELSMITPPTARSVGHFATAIEPKIFPKLKKFIYNGLSHTEPIPQNAPEMGGRFRMLRSLFRKTYEALEELTLSQDHCISQIGKTPLINGRTFNGFLCDLDELYTHKHDPCLPAVPSVTLNLKKLELGGFKVQALFDTPSIPAAAPRVRIHLQSLTRLVLNECDGIGSLLNELTLRKRDIRLTEVGFRIVEQRDDSHTGDWNDVADSLHDFLMSFEGLEILSLLWHGQHAPTADKYAKVLAQHHKTLQVYSYATRTTSDNFRFTVKPSTTFLPWAQVLPADKRPQLREFGFDLPDDLCTEDYPALRLFSQFKTLRTAHIRHFPKLGDSDMDQGNHFWRSRDGTVTRTAETRAAKFAELMALPYFALPPDEDYDSEMLDPFKLDELARIHATTRDNKLHPGFSMMATTIQTSTPVADPTNYVLKHRADTDCQFATIMRKVEAGTASFEEQMSYNDFSDRVHNILGHSEPSEADKPKLRLLVVGDWRYRDQLNLAGPRSWDSDVWTGPINANKSARRDASLDERLFVDEVDSDSEDDEIYGTDRDGLRPGFRKEFDISLLPIFFKITWKAQQDQHDSKWRWKATATPLEQTTLEGYGALGDVKSLDFAWQG